MGPTRWNSSSSTRTDRPSCLAPSVSSSSGRANLTGVWLIEGADDDGGDSESLFDLAQHNDMLSGTATTSYLDDGDHWLVQQLLTGSVSDAGLIQLSSYQVRILKGPAGGEYSPDAWYGSILDTDTIVGRSLDADDQRGRFVMTRQG